MTPLEKQKRRDRCRRKKSDLLLPRLTFINVDPEGELVECQLETTQQSMVSFKFSRVLDQPTEIAQNLVSVPCAVRRVELPVSLFGSRSFAFLLFCVGLIQKFSFRI